MVNDIKVGGIGRYESSLSIISFVLINKNRHNISKEFIKYGFKGSGGIEIFPKI